MAEFAIPYIGKRDERLLASWGHGPLAPLKSAYDSTRQYKQRLFIHDLLFIGNFTVSGDMHRFYSIAIDGNLKFATPSYSSPAVHFR